MSDVSNINLVAADSTLSARPEVTFPAAEHNYPMTTEQYVTILLGD